MKRLRSWLAATLAAALLLTACAPATPATTGTVAPTPGPVQVLRLATTTSTADTGLLDAILPAFEAAYQVQVEVVAVGTGQALALGVNGDADVLLVHARAREDAFVADGHGVNRLEVMYNDFILVGPAEDPAAIDGLATAKEALAAIATAGATFVSRGDDSGTHTKEQSLWASAGLTPTAGSGWYQSIGQGMGETLTFANESLGYTLTDRGTWLAQQGHLPNLAVLVGGASLAVNGDQALLNPYGVIPVNPEKHPSVAFDRATAFAHWITSVETQQAILAFGQAQYGQSLFYPSSVAWLEANP